MRGGMDDYSFFKKVLSYLAELNKGKQDTLIEDGWLSVDEASKIHVILESMGCIKKLDGDFQITRKGLNVLLYLKMDKIGDKYNEQVLRVLLGAS
jgi:hypothetical protein